jgi:glycosyltransferase involved in cell wall biosynthesis
MFYSDDIGSLNCSLYNIIYPAKYINEKYPGIHSADTFNISQLNLWTPEVVESIEKADLVLIERNLFGDALIREMQIFLQNKPVVLIWDDSYENIAFENASYSFWHDSIVQRQNDKGQIENIKIFPHNVTQLRRAARLAKAYIGPSRLLAEDWSKYTNAYRIYNYLDLDRYPEDAEPLYPFKGITIGWCGSLSHVSSFTDSGIIPALTYIGRKYDNVRIMTGGDKRIYDKINLPNERKIFSSYVPDEQWASLQKSIDIGIAPLTSPFDRRRSHIKVLEYMLLKIPWIASNFETYEELGEYGHLIENGVDNWKKAMCDAIENIDQYRELANGKAYEFAKEQTYEKNIDKLIAVYQHIISSPDRDDPQ